MSRLAIRTSRWKRTERLRHVWVWRSITEHVGSCRICHGYPNLWTFCWKWQLNNGFWMILDVLPQLSDKPVWSHQPEQTTATNISSVQFCGWTTFSLCYKKKKFLAPELAQGNLYRKTLNTLQYLVDWWTCKTVNNMKAYLYVKPSTYLSIYPSIHPSIISIYLFIYLSGFKCINHLLHGVIFNLES